MQRAFANQDEQRAFRKELEQMLRRGEAEQALDRARASLHDVAAADPRLIERAIRARVEDISITDWEKLATHIPFLEEQSEQTITALGIDFSWPGHFATSMRDGRAVLDFDKQGGFAPMLETNYYCDKHIYEVPSPTGEGSLRRELRFSTATRGDILEAYSLYGNAWQGEFVDVDHLIGAKGMDPLYGAIQACKAREDDNAEGDAYLLAACTSAILLHLAIKRTIETRGLPKPMAVLVGSNEDFPFFNAPVAAIDEAIAMMPKGEPKRPMPSPLLASHRPSPSTGEPETSVSGRELRSRLNSVADSDGVGTETAGTKSWLARLFGR